MMNSLVLYALVAGLTIEGCTCTVRELADPSYEDYYDNLSEYEVPILTATSARPAIPNQVVDKKVIKLLWELWHTQLDYLHTFQSAEENVTLSIGHKVEEMVWILHDAEWLMLRQLEELTIMPKTYKEALKEVLDDDTIGHQDTNWERMEDCLKSHYLHVKDNNMVRLMRTTAETARAEFMRRQKEIKSIVEDLVPAETLVSAEKTHN